MILRGVEYERYIYIDQMRSMKMINCDLRMNTYETILKEKTKKNLIKDLKIVSG